VAIYRRMSPQERLLQALQMNRSMRELCSPPASAQRQPDWSEAQVRRAVADRILYACTGLMLSLFARRLEEIGAPYMGDGRNPRAILYGTDRG